MGEQRKQVAVVLAGAVAKGAFEAGALAELVRLPVDIRSIVAASSGALNGTLLASAVHGAPSDDALVKEVDDLCTLWIRKGGASRAFNFNGWEFFGLRGASDQRDLLKLLSRNVKDRPHAAPMPAVALTVVVAPLAGVDLPEGTTFEHPCRFTNKDFQDQASLDRVFEAAVASSSFPGAFAPRTVTGVGDCVERRASNLRFRRSFRGGSEHAGLAVMGGRAEGRSGAAGLPGAHRSTQSAPTPLGAGGTRALP